MKTTIDDKKISEAGDTKKSEAKKDDIEKVDKKSDEDKKIE